VNRKRGTRLTLAGLCLAALSATAGAPLFAAEVPEPSSVEADRIDQSARVGVQSDESGLVNHGSALYNPFSTSFETAAPKPHAYATPSTRQNTHEGSPDLGPTAFTALVSAGLLIILVRVLIES
jgi:hypothetical protein